MADDSELALWLILVGVAVLAFAFSVAACMRPLAPRAGEAAEPKAVASGGEPSAQTVAAAQRASLGQVMLTGGGEKKKSASRTRLALAGACGSERVVLVPEVVGHPGAAGR